MTERERVRAFTSEGAMEQVRQFGLLPVRATFVRECGGALGDGDLWEVETESEFERECRGELTADELDALQNGECPKCGCIDVIGLSEGQCSECGFQL